METTDQQAGSEEGMNWFQRRPKEEAATSVTPEQAVSAAEVSADDVSANREAPVSEAPDLAAVVETVTPPTGETAITEATETPWLNEAAAAETGTVAGGVLSTSDAPAHSEPPPPPTPAVDLAPIEDALRKVADEQAALRRLFESRLHSDDVQAKAFQRLHDQLTDYRTHFIRQQMTPLLKDVIFCYDFAEQEGKRLSARREEPNTIDALLASIDQLRQMLLDVLYKFDVEPFRVEGDGFDRARQQAIGTVLTDDPGQDKCVAERGLAGFSLLETTLRREHVKVYKTRPMSAAPAAVPTSAAVASPPETSTADAAPADAAPVPPSTPSLEQP